MAKPHIEIGELRKSGPVEVVAGRLSQVWQTLAGDGVNIKSTDSSLPSGALQVWKFGHNAAVGTSYETIWIVGGLYPWGSWKAWDDATGSVVTLKSTDAADTSVEVAWEGLGADGELVSGTTTTDAVDGTTGVAVATNLNRLHRAYRVTAGTSTGSLQLTVGGTVIAQIETDLAATQLGLYTVPAGYTAYLQSLDIAVDDNSDGLIQLMTRPDGDAFYSRSGGLMVSGATRISYASSGWSSGLPFVEGTDIDVRGVKVSGGGSPLMSVNFHLALEPS